MITPQAEDRIDIREPIREICQRLGLDETYVSHIDFTPDEVIVDLYLGRDGRCRGAKYINDDGTIATESLIFKVFS